MPREILSTALLSTALIFSVITFNIFSPAVSYAEEPSGSQQSLPFDVRIVIDISGSMKQTDPNNLRIPALNLLLELMPEGAQAGIWTFGQYVNNLLPVAPVDQDWREKAKAAALKINSVGLNTNLTGALNDAAWGLKADAGFQQSIILLTDGQIDMAIVDAANAEQTNAKERNLLMTQVLEKYRKAGASIHTLALSDLADKGLLQRLALETGGVYSQADDAEALMKAFLRAFDRAVPAEQVPMDDNTFVIDSSVDELTALIFKRTVSTDQDSALLSPSGMRLSALDHPKNVRWHQDINFDLITIKQPEAGTWVAEADLDPSNRVTILTDLALSVEGIPATSFPTDKLDVIIKLTNEGSVVKNAEILRLTDVKMNVLTASGREGSKILSNPENPPVDGMFYEGLHRVREVGQYQIDIIAEGRTFQRKRSISMTVMEPIEVVNQPDLENNVYRIAVKPLAKNLDLERTRVIAKIKSPDDSTIIQSVLYNPEAQAWVSEISESKGPGEYSVELNVRGITLTDNNFKVKPDPIVFNLPITSAIESPVAVQTETQAAVDAAVDAAEGIAVNTDANVVIAAEVEEVIESESESESESEQTNANDEGLAWWVYLITALAGISVIGAGVWWFLLRKPEAVDAQTDRDKKGLLDDLEDSEKLKDEFAGDFDSLDEGDEEEIPLMNEPAPSESADSDSDSDSAFAVDDSTIEVVSEEVVADVVGDVVEDVVGDVVEESPILDEPVVADVLEEPPVLDEEVVAESMAETNDDDGFPTEDDFDENFSIDPDDELDFDEDSWGEFDEDKEDKKD